LLQYLNFSTPVLTDRAVKLPCLARAALALMILAPVPGVAAEPSVHQLVQSLQDEWSDIFYRLPVDEQAGKYEALLPRVHALVERYPLEAEPLVMEAYVLCTYAATNFSLGSLRKVERARELLVKSIGLNPTAMDGSAYVTLGNLYYRVPGWPISYGDDAQARQYLETALKLFPEALDTNYFYGDFLMGQGEFRQALPYLEKADKAPIRALSRLSDLKLKEELKHRLKAAQEQNEDRADFFSSLLSASGEGSAM
jgi:tetratricopeptide (TPR) repeat protein